MKKSLLALAIAVASLPAFAQVGADSASSAGASASTGNIGITSIMNLPAANPFSTNANMVNYSGRYRVDGVPVNSVASSFGTAPTWRCLKGGYGAALQAKDFGISLALPGGEVDICPREFRASIIGGLFDRAVLAKKIPANTVERDLADDGIKATLAMVCGDDEIANSLEGTQLQCAEPATTEDRKARWAREREQKQRASVDKVTGLPIVASVAPAPRQPRQPWQSGG